jgi:hypothetical protein
MLVESQATLIQFDQFEQARITQEKEFQIMRQNEEKRQTIAVRDWLSAANTEADQENYGEIRAQYPGTGYWLLQRRHVQAWLDPNSPSTPLLWLNGIPGAGEYPVLNFLS